MTALAAPVRPRLTVIHGGRGRPSNASLAALRDAAEEAEAELTARRAEEQAMAAQLFPLLQQAKLVARSHGSAEFRLIASIDVLLARHARRWADEDEGRAA